MVLLLLLLLLLLEISGFDPDHSSFAWSVRRELGKSLRDRGYEWSIVLPNSWKSALIPWFAKIPKRTGWKGEMRMLE